MENDSDYLSRWLGEIKSELDSESIHVIYDTLKANQFTSRLKLKLISNEQLQIMFSGSSELSLGIMAVLQFKLEQLRNESPLVKGKKINSFCCVKDTEHGEPSHSMEEPAAENKLKALEYEKEMILDEINSHRAELSELEITLESRNIVVKEPPPIGTSKLVCGRCHHRGHRNSITNPCNMDKCTGYTYCGLRDKHPEYIGETNQVKAAIKKKREKIEALDNQLNNLKNFETQSEHQFIKNMKPRLSSLNSSYAQNRPMLMRDLRLLRIHCKGKIPPVTSDDSEQLGILLEKCKREFKNKLGDEYNTLSMTTNDQAFATATNRSQNVNVFNISPPSKNNTIGTKSKAKKLVKRDQREQNLTGSYPISSSSQSEESDGSDNENNYLEKNKNRKRKIEYGKSRNRYRQIEPSFNQYPPFSFQPYHYSPNPMSIAMPMQFGTYMSPHSGPQYPFPRENVQFTNMQHGPILSGDYAIPATAQSCSNEQIPPLPAPNPPLTQAQHVQQLPFDVLLKAAEIADNR